MDADTYRDAAKAAARELGAAARNITCTLVVCGPPPYRHALTAFVPDPIAAAALVEAMPGSTWAGAEGMWRGLTVLLVIDRMPAGHRYTVEDEAWWPREHFEHPDVTPERAADAIEVVRQMHLVGGCS